MHHFTDINHVQEKSDEALGKQNEIVAQGRNIAIEKEKIEKTITDALKPLKLAKMAIIDFNKDAIVDLLKMEMPPEDVEVVGECFLIIKSIRDISWKTVRITMLEENFLQSLLNINCDLITLKQLSQCKGHLKVSRFSYIVSSFFVLFCVCVCVLKRSLKLIINLKMK